VKPALPLQALYGDQMCSMERVNKCDAGIDGLIGLHLSVAIPRYKHRARTTVALGTDNLGSGKPTLVPEIIRHGKEGKIRPHFMTFPIQIKHDA
jgi:hypothetical protein